MYWAILDESGVTGVIYSANDPAESDETITESWPHETEAEAVEAASEMSEDAE